MVTITFKNSEAKLIKKLLHAHNVITERVLNSGDYHSQTELDKIRKENKTSEDVLKTLSDFGI